MAWIELHQGLREHKKLFACADELRIGRTQMVGMLVSIWLWALDNAQDGSLGDVSNRTIARVCDYPEKKADFLVSALHKTGWLDKQDGAYHIHDWFDYAGKLMERREKDRARKKPKQNKNNGCSNGIPLEQHRNSFATVPYSTVQYSTVPNNCGGDGGDAREAEEHELRMIGLEPGLYVGITAGIVQQVMQIADQLIQDRTACAADYRNTFRRLLVLDGNVTQESCDLLAYAFETAEASGRKGDWNYIGGIMDRLEARGIRCVKDAILYDSSRPDKEVDL